MARKIVLADAGPLIGLARIDGLPWLRRLYKRISVTRAVRDEATGPRDLPGAKAISAALDEGWIGLPRREWRDPPLVRLGAGEASILGAALRHGESALVLLDDLSARREALRLGLSVVGTAGIIVQARRARLIPAARPVFARLADEGFHLSADLVAAILTELGEK